MHSHNFYVEYACDAPEINFKGTVVPKGTMVDVYNVLGLGMRPPEDKLPLVGKYVGPSPATDNSIPGVVQYFVQYPDGRVVDKLGVQLRLTTLDA